MIMNIKAFGTVAGIQSAFCAVVPFLLVILEAYEV